MDVDLFAGPGGWDVAALSLGLDPLGIEWDDAACATREAAGLRTLQADVAALDPMQFAPVRGLIGGPPCQAFSMAGKGAGRRAVVAYERAISRMAAGLPVDVEALDAECKDPRGHLVLEPLRWAMALRPEWIALEQVPPVLPLWEAMAGVLRELGYSTWCGLLSAERYGVPQTRQRAILIASSVREVREPPATHQRYIAPRKVEEASLGLFDAPEPERIVAPEDRHLLPWVSMAEALGWAGEVWGNADNTTDDKRYTRDTDSAPAPTVTSRVNRWQAADVVGFPRRADSGESVEINGVDYRSRDLRQASQPAFALTEKARSSVRFRAAGRVQYRRGGERLEESTPVDAPSPTVTSRADRWQVVDTGNTRGGSRESGRERSEDEPSAPLTTRADQMERRVTGQRRSSGPGAECDPRSLDEPSYTLRAGAGGGSAGVGRSGGVEWTADRPATTVAGDERVHPPGHKINAEDVAAGRNGHERRGPDAIRVAISEAAVLQSFPADYPWQGTKTKQFEQVGNAIPPGLARAVLRAVI